MPRSRRLTWALSLALLCAPGPGCASGARRAPSPDLRPCTDGYAYTRDGWRLGIRHYRPERPDPGKLPVVLCHGLGLNGTFWTITDDHLARAARRAGATRSSSSTSAARATARKVGPARPDQRVPPRDPVPRDAARRAGTSTTMVRYDVPGDPRLRAGARPASDRVNWVGHSLGGMLMFPYLELSPERRADRQLRGDGAHDHPGRRPRSATCSRANRGLRGLLAASSAPGGWAGR